MIYSWNVILYLYLFPVTGQSMDPNNERAKTWGQTKENQSYKDSNRVRFDALWNADGRYPISTIQIEQGEW